jgi:predicted MPP superfamily phosphohydrolase
MKTIRRFIWLALLPICLSLDGQKLTLPVHQGAVRFAAIGDMGTGDPPQYQVASRMNAIREEFPFDFVIMLGDNIYGGNSAADFQKKFELPYKLLLDSGVKFYASLGNHDAATQKTYKPFNMGGQQYYSYKKGNVQFFALDSNYMSPQEVLWLTKELENSTADWKVCYFHHPLYSSAKFHGASVELRQLLEPLFMKYGVQVVFSGHDHVYERTKPQNGIHYFIEGAAGELRKGDLQKTDITAAGYDQDQSFLLVEIAGDELDFQAVSRLGVTIDQGSFSRIPERKP